MAKQIEYNIIKPFIRKESRRIKNPPGAEIIHAL